MLFGFLYIPAQTSDLVGLTRYMHQYADIPWHTYLDMIAASPTPAWLVYVYAIGQIRVDGLLPAVSVGIVYGLLFISFYKFSIISKISGRDFALALFWFMSAGTLVLAVVNIRMWISSAILVWSFYQEKYESSSIVLHLPLYLISATFHSAGLFLVCLRLVYACFEPGKTVGMRFASSMLMLMLAFFALSKGELIVQATFEKADIYTSSVVFSYIWEYLIGLIAAISLAVSAAQCRKSDKYLLEDKSICGIILILIVISFGMIGTYSIFRRFISVASMFGVFSVMKHLDTSDDDVRLCWQKPSLSSYKWAYSFYSIVSFLILILSCARGDLTGMKFFVL